MDRRAAVLGEVAAPPPGRQTHCCSQCEFPIAVYGRLAPCLHIFCLPCASAMPACPECGAAVTKLEPIAAGSGPVFISSVTRQAFRGAASLAQAERQADAHREQLAAQQQRPPF
jgi:hypothetical protein